jgi:ACS family hexuronate transporter-like MFS transporter
VLSLRFLCVSASLWFILDTIPNMISGTMGTTVNLRWYVCGLLLLAMVINYIDRQVLSILAPDLQDIFGWNELEYGRIIVAFQIAYAGMMLVSGRIIDRVGTRIGFGVAVSWWSLAAMGHALARGALGFGIARFALGMGEAATFPAAIKGIAEWFPAKERATATGIFNSGPTIGAIVAPILVPVIAAHWGWQGAFMATGAIGLLWVAGWFGTYYRPEEHRRITAQELRFIRQGTEIKKTEKVPWAKLLKYRQTWAYVVAKMLPDPVWWFYLFWLPKFLAQNFGIRGTAQIAPLTVVYVLAGIGAVAGGYASSALIKRGWTVNRARKTTLGVIAAVMPFVIFSAYTTNPWTAILLIGLGLGLQQGFSTTVFTLAADMFPNRAIGSVIGIGGAISGVASILAAEITGRILLKDPGFYLPMFIFAGTAYLIALLVIHVLVPTLEPADIK